MPNGTNSRSQYRSSGKNGNKKNAQRKNRKKKNKKQGSILKKIFLSIVGVGLIGLVAGLLLFFYYAAKAPEVNRADLVDAVPTKILDKDGNLVKELGANAQNRDLVDVDEIPQVLQDAIISIEDHRFYKHHGIDPIRILGALAANLKRGSISEGGSTITQQLIKLSYFSTLEKDQTLERKAKEAWMAIQLERKLPKDEILALYINKVYMANNVYGMGTAAEYYFGKELDEINLAEAATLAGMPQAPSYYDPYSNPEETEKRRNTVLGAMVRNEKISPEERNEAMGVFVADDLVDHTEEADQSLVIDAYLQMVVDEVHRKTGLDVDLGGLIVYTNLDMAAQQHLYDTVNTDEYIQFPDDEIQTAATLVDVHSGAVTAAIGNRKKNTQLAVNYAVSRERSVGSTIKPLIDYGPAIEYLNYSTGKRIVDEEWSYPSTGDPLYNYDFGYKGEMTIREALVDSRNVPAAKVLMDVGFDNASAFLNKLGIHIFNDGTEELYESNAIGGEISSVDLAAAYAGFANGGTYYEPATVKAVHTEDGQIFEFKADGTTAMKDSTAYMVTDMLKDVITQSAPEAAIPGLPQAGKTGTTDYRDDELEKVGALGVPNVGKDSWFVGYTTNYALSVWLGYEQPNDYGNFLDYDTRTITRYIYRELMGFVSQEKETSDWERPASVTEEVIEKYSDPLMKPGPNTPSDLRVAELFVKGTEPSQVSKKFGEKLEVPSGLKASYDKDKDQLNISWNKYASQGSQTPQYTITVNDRSSNTTETGWTIQNPPKGTLTITLTAKVGSAVSPAASISLTIKEEADKDKDKEKDNDESKTESSSDSSSETAADSSSELKPENEESDSEAKESEESKEDEAEKADPEKEDQQQTEEVKPPEAA